jgi:thiamine-phosphate pyrophosphorylase
MQVTTAIRGFYAVLDRDDEVLARALLSAGARVLQLRLKPGPSAATATSTATRAVVQAARMARRVCAEFAAALIINDRFDVALLVGAHGVHLGQHDLPLAAVRAVVGSRLWIGISTHDLAQVTSACAGGADYVGYGPVFQTSTKRNPDPTQGLIALGHAVNMASVPVVAIGGITPSQASAVYATGAAAICAISAVNQAGDITSAARALMTPYSH